MKRQNLDQVFVELFAVTLGQAQEHVHRREDEIVQKLRVPEVNPFEGGDFHRGQEVVFHVGAVEGEVL